MPVKRQSAFDAAVIEQTRKAIKTDAPGKATTTQPAAVSATHPALELPSEPNVSLVPVPEAISKNKKPKNKDGSATEISKKATYNLRQDTSKVIPAIRASLEQHGSKRIATDDQIIEQALSFMNFCLEDENSRPKFWKLYKQWLKSRKSKPV